MIQSHILEFNARKKGTKTIFGQEERSSINGLKPLILLR
jgi:hypothetical protein